MLTELEDLKAALLLDDDQAIADVGAIEDVPEDDIISFRHIRQPLRVFRQPLRQNRITLRQNQLAYDNHPTI